MLIRQISPDTKFAELGLDSLDQVELIIAIEEEFKMELTDEVAEKISTPKEATEVVKEALAARE